MKVYNQKIVDSAWVYTAYRIILWLSIILKLLLYTSFHEGGAWGGVYIARSLMFFGTGILFIFFEEIEKFNIAACTVL